MKKKELLETITLVERMMELSELWFDETNADPMLNMSLFIVKRHLMGRLVTPTSLALASNVPYTTATRRITAMEQQGLFDKRPRTRTGKSYSLHPSPKLMARTVSFLTGVRSTLDQSDLSKPRDRKAIDSAEQPQIIPPPSLARKTLGFGTGLTILVMNDPAYSINPRLRRELTFLMGGHVRFPDASIDDLRERILANAQRPISEFDVVAIDLPLIAEFAERGILMPLDDIASDSNINRADFDSAAWRGTISNDRQYAVPILINPELLFYRKDLFRQANLDPPHSTDALLAAARALHAPAKGQFGVSWTGARGGPAGQAFIQFLADFGQPVFHLERTIDGYRINKFDKNSIKPAIDTPRAVATANFMLQLLEFSAPNVLDLSWGGQIDLLREGRVAMAYEWASRTAQLGSSGPSRELGFLPHPVGSFPEDTQKRQNIAPIGGFAFGLPSNIDRDRISTAWSAIEWLSSPEIIKLLVQHGGFVTPRLSVAADPDVRELSPMISAVDQMTRKGQIRLWPRPPVSTYSSMVQILGEEVHDMLRGLRSVEDALSRAQDRIEDDLLRKD